MGDFYKLDLWRQGEARSQALSMHAELAALVRTGECQMVTVMRKVKPLAKQQHQCQQGSAQKRV